MNSGMTTGANTMKIAVTDPSTARIRKNSVDASRKASARLRCSRSSVKTGTKAAVIAWSATSMRSRLGIWKAIVNAEKAPLVAK